MASRHLHLLKHEEINLIILSQFYYQLISLSQQVHCVSLDLLHCWDHIPSNLKSFHKDYYRLHKKLGSDVPFQLLTGRPCILGLLHRINKR